MFTPGSDRFVFSDTFSNNLTSWTLLMCLIIYEKNALKLLINQLFLYSYISGLFGFFKNVKMLTMRETEPITASITPKFHILMTFHADIKFSLSDFGSLQCKSTFIFVFIYIEI